MYFLLYTQIVFCQIQYNKIFKENQREFSVGKVTLHSVEEHNRIWEEILTNKVSHNAMVLRQHVAIAGAMVRNVFWIKEISSAAGLGGNLRFPFYSLLYEVAESYSNP